QTTHHILTQPLLLHIRCLPSLHSIVHVAAHGFRRMREHVHSEPRTVCDDILGTARGRRSAIHSDEICGENRRFYTAGIAYLGIDLYSNYQHTSWPHPHPPGSSPL